LPIFRAFFTFSLLRSIISISIEMHFSKSVTPHENSFISFAPPNLSTAFLFLVLLKMIVNIQCERSRCSNFWITSLTMRHPARKKINEVKTAPLTAAIDVTCQNCKAAKSDDVPDSNVGPGIHLLLFIAPRYATYGKYVHIDDATSEGQRQHYQGKVISCSQCHRIAMGNEIDANRRLDQRNVLKMQQYHEDEVFDYLILPNTERDSLRDVMHGPQQLIEEAARPIFRELALGVQHIHSNGIVHGQITPACILFYKDHVRLSDFSLCSLAARGEKSSITPTPMPYASPESLKQRPFDGVANDIWSCGIILYEMLAGMTPSATLPKADKLTHAERGTVVYPKTFSSTVIFLVNGILNPVPSERASIEQVLAHPWMQKTREVQICYTLRPQLSLIRKRKGARSELS
jgi:serine/threonine protein kinase